MSEPTELSDEALAKLLYETGGEAVLWDEYGDDQPATWDDLPEYDALDQGDNFWLPPKQQFRDMVRALRAALCPPVAPLAPGETVTIMDARDTEYAYIKAVAMRSAAYLALLSRDGNDWAIINLDAAGVAQLEAVCRRWLAAQGGEQ